MANGRPIRSPVFAGGRCNESVACRCEPAGPSNLQATCRCERTLRSSLLLNGDRQSVGVIHLGGDCFVEKNTLLATTYKRVNYGSRQTILRLHYDECPQYR